MPGYYLKQYWFIINTLRLRENGRLFADDIFKCIFANENIWIPIQISPKFVPKGPINNIPSLVQIMACCRSGDKPLSEPMIVSLLIHISITQPQWVYPSKVSSIYAYESKVLESNVVRPSADAMQTGHKIGKILVNNLKGFIARLSNSVGPWEIWMEFQTSNFQANFRDR